MWQQEKQEIYICELVLSYPESVFCKNYYNSTFELTFAYLIHGRHSLLILGWIYAQMQEVAESREKRLFTADWLRA